MIIGLQVRHFKAYKNKNFIPIGNEHNFVSYSGENGAGKSSILEALDTFLNNKRWLLTKKTIPSDSYICPLFLIPKDRVTRLKNDFETISTFFWELEEKDKSDKFFEARKQLDPKLVDTHFLIFLGEDYDRKFKIPFGETLQTKLLGLLGTSFSEKKFLKELKSIYSYVYIPVEIDSENFTKIETDEMQKIYNKEIIDEIKQSLKQRDIDTINSNLNSFVSQLEEKLEGKYFYDTGDESTKKLTQKSLVDTILEIYFKKRVLMKGNRQQIKSSKKMSELSAGEKRESLINLVYVFLKEAEERDSLIIIGIDEPENSLHTAICYEQFEKLKKVSKGAQVLITTHWYGFIPIIDKGLLHFLKNSYKENSKGVIEEIIEFHQKIDLYLYPFQTKNIPKNFSLKSTNDLVQSIYHSLKAKTAYNWLICEGPSDQLYLEYFFADKTIDLKLRVIPVGGIELVKKFYKYLSLPISENEEGENKGKVFCLTDTDSDMRKNDIKQNDAKLKKNLVIKRLVEDKFNTSLEFFEKELKQTPMDVEKSLNPTIFLETLKALDANEKYIYDLENVKNINGNTSIKNLRNFELEDYFKNEAIKNKFAHKYVEIMNSKENPDEYIPEWVKSIKSYFSESMQG